MDNKPYLVFYGAVDTFSGYGARARDIVKALIESDKYNIEIISCSWGSTPRGFLDASNLEHKQILDRINPNPQLKKQPDIWIMNTIPSEMQRIGKYNILITAGIETTVCDPSWIIGCNNADLVLTSSKHAKLVFESSKFEERNQQTNQVVNTISLKTPIEVLFEGVNTDIYKRLTILPKSEVVRVLNTIKEEFCYLFVGHWLQGDLGEDRKDIGGMIKTFLETFKGKKSAPALILKTNGASYSIIDRNNILNKINAIKDMVGGKDLPNIYLLHGELEDGEMNILYNHPKVKAMVSFTKGEGFGRPLLEFSTSMKPVIASGWSGHTDFLTKSILLPGTLTQVHPSAVVDRMILADSQWFTADYRVASKTLENVWKSYKNFLDSSREQARISRTKFSLDEMSSKLIEILDRKTPQVQPIKLPELKRIK